MNIAKRLIFLLLNVIVSFISLRYMIQQYSDILGVQIMPYIKMLAMYTDSTPQFTSIDFMLYFTYFSLFAFGFLFCSSQLLGASNKYRGLRIIRYGTRKKYLFNLKKGGYISSLIIITVTSISLILIYMILSLHGIVINYSDRLDALFLLINIYIFINICLLVYIYCIIKYNDIVAVGIVLVIIFLAFNANNAFKQICIIAYRDYHQELLSLAIKIPIYFVLDLFIYKKLKRSELI